MKKREVLKLINNCTRSLADMSADAATLEMFDNDKASRRLKRDISLFKEGPLKEFTDAVYKIREEIRNKK